MKQDGWIIYGVIAFTSLTTFGLVSDGSIIGVFRGVLAAIILDGLVIYWEGKRTTLKDDNQRKYAGYMMWAGVAILLLFAIGFAVEYSLPSDVTRNISIFDYKIDIMLSELIVYIASTIIGGWVVLTLGVVLYLRGIDPETQVEIETVQMQQEKDKVKREADKERQDEELSAYRIANKHTARELGTIKAMELYKKDLESLGKYTVGEVYRMVEDARQEIARQQIAPAPKQPTAPMMTYAAKTESGLELVQTDPKA